MDLSCYINVSCNSFPQPKNTGYVAAGNILYNTGFENEAILTANIYVVLIMSQTLLNVNLNHTTVL